MKKMYVFSILLFLGFSLIKGADEYMECDTVVIESESEEGGGCWEDTKEHIRRGREQWNLSCRHECLPCSLWEEKYVMPGNFQALELHRATKKHTEAMDELLENPAMQQMYTELSHEVPVDVDSYERLEKNVKRAMKKATVEYDKKLEKEKIQQKEKEGSDRVAEWVSFVRGVRGRHNPHFESFECIACSLALSCYSTTNNTLEIMYHMQTPAHQRSVDKVTSDAVLQRVHTILEADVTYAAQMQQRSLAQ
jgi:hypothetical protein